MPIQMSVTDERTGAAYPTAYLRIDDTHVQFAAGTVVLDLNTYADAANAAAGKRPIVPLQQIVLNPTEIGRLRDVFIESLEALLLARNEYSRGSIVS